VAERPVEMNSSRLSLGAEDDEDEEEDMLDVGLQLIAMDARRVG
jgi:hypothetical protein